MKFSKAIKIYVQFRHTNQSTFVNGEAILRSACRTVGDVSLCTLTAARLAVYLDNSQISMLTRRGQSSILKGFLQHWSSRGALEPFTLPLLAPRDVAFIPHLYSEAQVRALLQATEECQHGSRAISGRTLRMFLLMLYATGASIGEVLALRASDLTENSSYLTFRTRGAKRSRRIPLCRDLQIELQKYLSLSTRAQLLTRPLFCSHFGTPLDGTYLSQCFRRLQKTAAVTRKNSTMRLPRMQDFRASFAVARLRSWLDHDGGVTRMLPALSTYMGFSNLAAAAKFLPLVPECYTADLKKLSPQVGKHWKNEAVIKMCVNL